MCGLCAQVLALSQGQQREEGSMAQLVAAVADARRAAGTHGHERSKPGAGARLRAPPHTAASDRPCVWQAKGCAAHSTIAPCGVAAASMGAGSLGGGHGLWLSVAAPPTPHGSEE